MSLSVATGNWSIGEVPISTNSSPHLSFYLGIYGGLAVANTVS